MLIVQLIVWILFVGVIVWAIQSIIPVLPVNAAFKKVAQVLLIAAACIWLIFIVASFFGVAPMPGYGPTYPSRHWR